jgi:hypothetical protein
MASIRSILPLLLASIPAILAIPDVTVIPLEAPYACAIYPNGSSVFRFVPSDTGRSGLDGDHPTLDGDTIRLTPVLDEAQYGYLCDPTNGNIYLTALEPYTPVFLTGDEEHKQLRINNSGVTPQTYAHDLAGVRQPGVFLGLDNSTTWAFSRVILGRGPDVAAGMAPFWDMRLLEKGGKTRNGEIEGFLKLVSFDES